MTQAEALAVLKTGANCFLTGGPGSGKTHTVNAYVAWLRSHGIEPALTASTGIAATHIGGMTVHAWSGIGIREELTPRDLDEITSKEHVVRRVMKAPVLIIDEVSMLSGQTLDMVERVAREARRSERAFGGMQVVLVGDFFQLPPVGKGGRTPSFAFESDAWKALNPLPLYLTEQHRHEDATLASILENIRTGRYDASDVSKIAAREADPDEDLGDLPRLFTHNADVDRLNAEKLDALRTPAKRFQMESAGREPLVEALKRGCLSPECLDLKIGAVVMATKNNPVAGYANGTTGVIAEFESGTGYPVMETRAGRRIAVAPSEWAVEEQGKVRAKITQVPLRLAWAVTIHKSQGASMDAAAIDLSRAFEYGQGYVALSRLRRLEGLHLLGWHENALAIHPSVRERDEEFRASSEAAAEAFSVLEERGEREALEQNFIRASGGTLEASSGPRPKKKDTYEETLEAIEKGASTLQGLAKERGLTVGTMIGHLEKLVGDGRLTAEAARTLAPKRVVDALPAIETAAGKAGFSALTPVFKKLKGRFSFDELRLARLLLREN